MIRVENRESYGIENSHQTENSYAVLEKLSQKMDGIKEDNKAEQKDRG